MSILFVLLARLCSIYLLILFARVILDWIQVFNRSWRPSGPILVIANVIYALTDPPVKALRGIIPPLRLGGIALDVGFLVIVFGVIILERIFISLAIAV
ncbi:YggT family protein [Bowdeniella nasicola]|uniref:YggT family protein n=1 Tax=Bowdeniella nasicola TaxID=208480 RepID=A0A1H4B9M7_9ACTO|nr:YggT family protein [Bowdeniella nasicola]SEA44668.1 YggT family protein [Bowdeniella nasicola]